MGQVEGMVEPGYEPVRDAFAANFAERGETGAAVAVYVRVGPWSTWSGAWPIR